MLFSWIRNRRRSKLRARPFPEQWEDYLRANVAHYCLLSPDEQTELRGMIHVFLAEKHWEGCGGLELTDEIRLTIAAQACLLLLGLSHSFFRNVISILVYPSTVVPPEHRPGVFEQVSSPVDAPQPLLGQAFLKGPIILVWDEVLHGARHPERGHNVVYHEFAHKLDMLDGVADGTPPLISGDKIAQWVSVCTVEFDRLRNLARQGRPTFLDAYATVNEAEFFAVATEEFFDRPLMFQETAPDLYQVLSDYYRQDPAKRVNNTCIVPQNEEASTHSPKA